MTNQYTLWHDHSRLIVLAVPMILANITTPLLGLVDTAVLGHMQSPSMLAGASIGALILTQIYWVCGFLRMSTTGLSAQARGRVEDHDAAARVLWQTVGIAIAISMLLLILQVPILRIGIALADPSTQVEQWLSQYYQVRVWGAPAALVNIAMIGWLVGQQRTRLVMIIQITGNLLNGVLDVGLVYGLGWGVEGVALASVFAEYTMATMALVGGLQQIGWRLPSTEWFNDAARRVLLKLNSDMLIRNLALQGCLAFLTLQGARLGETHAAVNAILMQFFVLIALGLDGIAHAVEALVGEASGAKNQRAIVQRTNQGLVWSSFFALAYTLLFWMFGTDIIQLLTQHNDIIEAAFSYLPLMVVLPILAHWCFLYDGVFVGLTRASSMRNSMVFSALIVFFPVWFVTQSLGNVALWYALLAFLVARGVTLAIAFALLNRRNQLVSVAEQ